ncbi:DUF4179 domain-containing protein [Bacillus sp. CGMCC 1.16607]|uniref:DUF4179 domain-containing protein n=1 Tax=Bacillus sp. CGMCC 1.16607 TaxID=3351842 RepID=UPI003637448A
MNYNDLKKDELEPILLLKKRAEDIPNHIYSKAEYEESLERISSEWSTFQKSRRTNSILKKITVLAGLAASLFIVFVASGFVSPAMAEMVSKIPPFHSIFKQDEVHFDTNGLFMELKNSGFDVKIVEESNENKVVSIVINKDQEELQLVREEIEHISSNYLDKQSGFEGYKINVKSYQKSTNVIQFDKERADVLSNIVQPILTRYDYKLSWGVGHNEVDLWIAEDENKESLEQIKLDIQEAFAKETGQDVRLTFNVHQYNKEKREQQDRWAPVITTISGQVMQEERFKIDSYDFDIIDGVVIIKIMTNLDANEPQMKSTIAELRNTMLNLLNRDEVKERILDDKFEINIVDKKNLVIK